MVNALNSAVAAKVDGIACSLIDPTAFNSPVASALSAGIPVVAYNADAKGNPRLAYIGQDLEFSGELMGEHIVELVPSGEVALFIATPGSLNIQPRINGALTTLKKHPSIKTNVIATGAAVPAELTVIESYFVGHPNTKGMFAVDAGSTQGVAQTIEKHGAKETVKGGGYDLVEVTEKLLAAGDIQFTIDQQPYLQGFLPVVELYLHNVSKGLSGIADVDTGIKFLTKETVEPYNTTKSRYEGTSSKAGVA
jgi:simple sugar transport system substrate-binding protein